MSAATFFVDAAVLAQATVGSQVALPAAAGRHAVSVLRMRIGESADLTDGLGRCAHAEVIQIGGRDSCCVRVVSVDLEPEPDLRFVVAQALVKGEHGERAVDLLTQAGVDEIIPWQAERSVARWEGDRASRGMQRWRDAMVAAALQSHRARWPLLHPMADVTGIARAVAQAGAALVLHESAERGLDAQGLPAAGTVVIVVGPEGGLTDGEVRELTRAGGALTRLGTPVLRASSAGAFAVAACSTLTRWNRDRIGS